MTQYTHPLARVRTPRELAEYAEKLEAREVVDAANRVGMEVRRSAPVVDDAPDPEMIVEVL